MNDSEPARPDRRGSPRRKIQVPVELHVEGTVPVRGATSDLSASGCYIESRFVYPVGTVVDMKIQLENTLLVAAIVVTSDPQVGNGIRFEKMLSEDRQELQSYLEKLEQAESSEQA